MPIVGDLHQVPRSFVLTLIIVLMPPVMAAIYAIRPSERGLALMRPLSLAAIFAALGSTLGGLSYILQGLTVTSNAGVFRAVAGGVSVALVPLYFGFGCLTVAWLLVALGMRRAAR